MPIGITAGSAAVVAEKTTEVAAAAKTAEGVAAYASLASKLGAIAEKAVRSLPGELINYAKSEVIFQVAEELDQSVADVVKVARDTRSILNSSNVADVIDNVVFKASEAALEDSELSAIVQGARYSKAIISSLNAKLDKVVSESNEGISEEKANDINEMENLSELQGTIKELEPSPQESNIQGKMNEKTDVAELTEKMQPPVIIKFRCPEGVDTAEFLRQIKGQERGLNGQSVAENMENRKAYQERKEASECGNGRAKEATEAQRIAREKAYHSRIASDMKNGMSYVEAKAETENWLKTKAALHNPDQIAGGNPVHVSRMGDANVNSSIGSQWRSRVGQLETATNELATKYTREELLQIKMNVKLEVE